MSIFLAQLWSVYLLVVGVAIMMNFKNFLRAAQEIVDSAALMLVTGAVTLILGLIMVMVHNVWVLDWRLLITLLAWLTLAKGIIRLIFPGISEKIIKWMTNPKALRIAAGFSMVLGLYLSYIAYWWW